jgi:hypothetical protein
MSTLLNAYNEMSTEQQESLGKGGSKITQSGCPLVTIDSFTVVDGKRVKVEFKNAAGQTIDYTGFLTNQDPSKVEAAVQRVMTVLKRICTAAGMDLNKVLAKSVTGSVTYASGTVATEDHPLIKGKKIYITTTTEVEPDAKDAKKVWVRQVVDSRHFFDTKKRSGLEISADVDEGQTMEGIEEEAKATFEIHYKHTASVPCQTKLAQLQGGAIVNTAAGSTENISDDDI